MIPNDLTYAATARCPCGAGLAYPSNVNPLDGYWDCSAILLGTAVPSGQPGSVTHIAQLPFIFWEIKSERQPGRSTTRPDES